jgi:hypothetical protein
MSKGITYTDEQLAIRDAVQDRGGPSLLAEAGAGCAKTSTMKLSAQGIKQPGLALAFNKKNATDLSAALPEAIQAKSFNALGHAAWARVVEGKLTLDDRKNGKIINEVAKERGVKLSPEAWVNIKQMVDWAQLAGLVPKGAGPEGLVPDNPESWEDIGKDHGLLGEEITALGDMPREVLQRSITLARQGTISFNDQVYCSSLLGGKFGQFPLVFVDENQDLNQLNHLMVEKSLRSDGRIAAFGDRRQAIYAFRGALGDSAQRIKTMRGSWTELPLMTTFRCPKAVVARQQEHVPGFRAWHGNPEGTVEKLGEGWNWAEVQAKKPNPKSPVAVLCRNNAPLVSFAFKLIRRRVGVSMAGRDIGKGLLVLVEKLAGGEAMGILPFLGKLHEWEGMEVGKELAKERQDRADGVRDRDECLRAVVDGTGCRDSGELGRGLKDLFSREGEQVVLSSGHRAKGMEWDCVLHLDPWRVPAKRAEGLELEQELNLRYVIETRTRHTLLMANMKDFELATESQE